MLNDLIHIETPTVAQIIPRIRNDTYFIDESFQRRLVWTNKQQVRLIETMLLGFPMPEFYMWQQPIEDDGEEPRFSIVDGQQRLKSIVEYLSNEWPLKRAYLDRANRESVFSDEFWRDLGPAQKTIINNYQLNFRRIPSQVSADEINRVFVRLNETDRSLNPQEIRHASFNGEFINCAERAADLPTLKEWNLFSDRQIRRMADIEFASSLLIYLREGIVGDTATTINKMYDRFNDRYEFKNRDLKSIREGCEKIHELVWGHADLQQFFLSVVHVYSLFAALDITKNESIAERTARSRLRAFCREYTDADSDLITVNEYRKGASSRTRSRASRIRRVDALVDWLRGEQS